MKNKKITIELPQEERFAVAPALYSIVQAATALGVARSTLYVLIAEKQLQTVKIGKRHLIPVTEIQDFVSRLKK